MMKNEKLTFEVFICCKEWFMEFLPILFTINLGFKKSMDLRHVEDTYAYTMHASSMSCQVSLEYISCLWRSFLRFSVITKRIIFIYHVQGCALLLSHTHTLHGLHRTTTLHCCYSTVHWFKQSIILMHQAKLLYQGCYNI